MRFRFAPSPTGYIHVGNLRTALLNWLFARHSGGEFMLRIDDTDIERSEEKYENAIYEDLTWLGLNWDLSAKQSTRMDIYNDAADKLKASGRLYPCFESAEELELKRKVQLSQGKPPVYDRGALNLSKDDIARYENEGRRPHWRFLLSDNAINWHDLGRGDVHFSAGHLSDPVLFREDGRPLYTLTSVVDDGEFHITHIVRGEDHVVNTAAQIDIFNALGYDIPTFAHVPLMVEKDGKSLSKRLGSLAIRDLRRDDSDPMALNAYLAHLGLSVAARGDEKLADIAKNFNIESYGRASPRYDEAELKNLQIKYLRQYNYTDVQHKLQKIAADMGEDLWLIIRDNIDNMDDAKKWHDIILSDKVDYYKATDDDESQYLKTALDLLPSENEWHESSFKNWTMALKEKTTRKGKTLFHPLRLSITGMSDGPEMGKILPHIARDIFVLRLKNSLL
jgi:glutamyl-tRNA synthetase